MNIAKISNRPDAEGYKKDLDTDIFNLFLFAQGRVRFGNGTHSGRGENISGEFRTFLSGAADAETAVPHGIGEVPIGYIVLNQDKAGILYSSATAWTSTNVYLKSSVSATTYKIFLLK